MDAVVHFEMPYADADRVAAFDRSAFGWDTEALGAAMGHYVRATTAATDSRSSPTPGATAASSSASPTGRRSTPSGDLRQQRRRRDGVSEERRRHPPRRADGDPGRRQTRRSPDSEGNRVGTLAQASRQL